MIDPAVALERQPPGHRAGDQPGSRLRQATPGVGRRSEADATLIENLHMEFPFAGSRMLQGLLVQEGFKVGRLHVATLMKRMGIEALYRRPNTSKQAPGHKIHLYLLRKLPITQPNQVWAMDITYIPMARGFIYLAAVLDWFARRVLAWRVSITLEADFCIEAVQEALARHGKPEIFNTDQGSRFTSADFIRVLADREIKISMDSKGRCRNVSSADHATAGQTWEAYVRCGSPGSLISCLLSDGFRMRTCGFRGLGNMIPQRPPVNRHSISLVQIRDLFTAVAQLGRRKGVCARHAGMSDPVPDAAAMRVRVPCCP